jgi:hypothetical protein
MTIIETAVTEHRCEAPTIGDITPYRYTTSATADWRGRAVCASMPAPCASVDLTMAATSEPWETRPPTFRPSNARQYRNVYGASKPPELAAGS